MDYLTVKEVAELKGCSERYIQQSCKAGKMDCVQEINTRGRIKFSIPISALPENLQSKYYKRLKAETGTAPELIAEPLKPTKNAVKKRLEEYTAAERETIAKWCRILKEWQEVRQKYKTKATIDSDFVGKCRIEYGDTLEISVDILYRKYAAYKANDYDGLLDKRGGWNRGSSTINEDVWRMFTRLYLVSSQPTVSRCYTDVKAWVQVHYPELYSSIPGERAFRRRIKSEIPDCVIAYTRLGQKACFDKYSEGDPMIDKEFLEGVGVTDAEAVEKITSAYTTDMQAQQTAADDLKQQLADANDTIKSYQDMDIEGIKQSAAEWQQKAEQLEADQKAKAYSDSLDKFVQAQGMKNDIYAAHLKKQLTDAELKFDDAGTLIGGEDIVKKLKESCPDAFAETEQHKPHFTDSTPGDTQKSYDDATIRSVMGLK